jgi:hypothetical protein
MRTLPGLALFAATALAFPPLAHGEESRREVADVRVYVHYRHAEDRAIVDELADLLGSLDYQVTDKRLVTQPTAGDVRYFHADDRHAAEHVKALVEQFLTTKRRTKRLGLLERIGRFDEARPGLVEVWLPP